MEGGDQNPAGISGASIRAWMGLIHVHYMSFVSGGLILVGGLSMGRLFRGGLFVGWDVIGGCSGSMSCIVGSLLAGSNGVRWKVLTLVVNLNNNEQ